MKGAMVVNDNQAGSGPIFLDNVDCSDTDTELISCPTRLNVFGLRSASCSHNEDIGVACIGMSRLVANQLVHMWPWTEAAYITVIINAY